MRHTAYAGLDYAVSVTPADFRRLALSLPDTAEGKHFHVADFGRKDFRHAGLQTGRVRRIAADARATGRDDGGRSGYFPAGPEQMGSERCNFGAPGQGETRHPQRSPAASLDQQAG